MLISSIYKRTLPAKAPSKQRLTFLNVGPSGKASKETLELRTGKRNKRKRKMASYKPKTVKFSKGIREVARMIYSTWIEYTKKYRGDKRPVFVPNALRSDTQPLNKGSLEARLCGWIEQNAECHESATVPDCVSRWTEILRLIREEDAFMHKGYGALPPPTLEWLFSFHREGDYNVNRVLNQAFVWNYTFRSSDHNMV
jgi:hypothetical protein